MSRNHIESNSEITTIGKLTSGETKRIITVELNKHKKIIDD